MSLYLPPAFTCEERSAIARLIAEHPFATLVTARAEELAITHLPLLLLPDREPYGTIIGHVARAPADPHHSYSLAASSRGPDLTQGELYRLGAITTVFSFLVYAVAGTPWVLFVTR